MVATDPDSDIGTSSEPDNIMARHEDPYYHEPADRTYETNPTGIRRSENSGADENTVACAMIDDRDHVDEPVARKGHNIQTGVVQSGEVEMTPRGAGGERAGGILHRPFQGPHRLGEEQHTGPDQLPQQ